MTAEQSIDGELEQLLGDDDGELLECAVCGVPGRYVLGVLVNPGPGPVPRFCSGPVGCSASTVGRLRAHGPFVPAAPAE